MLVCWCLQHAKHVAADLEMLCAVPSFLLCNAPLCATLCAVPAVCVPCCVLCRAVLCPHLEHVSCQADGLAADSRECEGRALGLLIHLLRDL